MELRPYQTEAVEAILHQWQEGIRKTLLVLPTGTGKTIVFSEVIRRVVLAGGRVLILAHREELLQQAADKLIRATGIMAGLEKAESHAIDGLFSVIVGSVQTLQNLDRLAAFAEDEFTHIVVDEAHHAVSPSYRRVLDHFANARVLGVTATADRGDKVNLGELFETVAYEYSLIRAVREGYLSPLKVQTIPLNIDLSSVRQAEGDFKLGDVANALDPYLEQIADILATQYANRKTVVFLPLIATSQKFLACLQARGIAAAEVNGQSSDRREVLEDFHAGKYKVLCNAMLLTEGWDEPSVDCIVCLRPTRIRALYAQIIGRGTRLFPGKDNLLILDFLWHTERFDLCRPVHLVCKNEELSGRVAEILAEDTEERDLLEAEEAAEGEAAAEREESLKKMLEEQRHKKAKLVDPLQYEVSISADGKTAVYTPDPAQLWQFAPPSDGQKSALERWGVNPDSVTNRGHAAALLDALQKRRDAGLATPKQIRFLERHGFKQVGTWTFEAASRMITRFAENGWMCPRNVNPATWGITA